MRGILFGIYKYVFVCRRHGDDIKFYDVVNNIFVYRHGMQKP